MVRGGAPSLAEYSASYVLGVPDRDHLFAPSRYDVGTNLLTRKFRRVHGWLYPWEIPDANGRYDTQFHELFPDKVGLKSPAITSGGDFKSKDTISYNRHFLYPDMSGRRGRRMRIQNGKPPLGAEMISKSGTALVMGPKGWHQKFAKARPSNNPNASWYKVRYDPFIGSYRRVGTAWRWQNGHYIGPSGRQQGRGQSRSRSSAPNGRAASTGKAHNLDSGQRSNGLKISSVPQSGEQFLSRGTKSGVSSWDVRLFAGSLVYKNATTVAAGGVGPGSTSWQVTGVEIGGQWYALATQTPYFGTSNPIVNSLLFYEDWGVEGTVEFVPAISGFSNPDIRLTVLVSDAIDMPETVAAGSFVGGVASEKATLTRTALMANPGTCTKPGWTDNKFECKIPRVSGNGGGWFKVNSPSTGGVLMDWSKVTAGYRQSCPFAVFVNISGTIPATTDLIVADVYFNLRIKARNQRVTQLSGANFLARPSETRMSDIEKKLDQLLLGFQPVNDDKKEDPALVARARAFEEVFHDEASPDFQRFIAKERARRGISKLVGSEDVDLQKKLDDYFISRNPPKKGSNKGSKPNSWVDIDDNKSDAVQPS